MRRVVVVGRVVVDPWARGENESQVTCSESIGVAQGTGN